MQIEEILSALIRINTENPPGKEGKAALFLKQLFGAAGIENQVLGAETGRESFIATLGIGPRSLLFLSHTDVVPAGDGWDFPPFSGDVKGGVVYGRGALDCKSLVAAEAYAMLELARRPNLKGKLIFAATADEEAGGKMGVRYLLEAHPEVLRADFAVNEGGEEPLLIGGKLVDFIQVGEKGTAWTKLVARGVACHGSVPAMGDNAVVKMSRALEKLSLHEPPVCLLPEVQELLQRLVSLKGAAMTVAEDTADKATELFEDKTFSAYLKAISRMTISPNLIHGGLKTNIVPDFCEAQLDIRVLPGQDQGFVFTELRRLLGKEIEISIPDFNAPTFSPTSSPFYKTIIETIGEMGAQGICLPCLSAGATDSRYLRRKGIPSYGLALMAPNYDPDIKKTMHGRNERIDVPSLKSKADFLIRLAERYLGA